ncbi:MAG: hypothetical protein WDO18_01325 [Acidobacteriota bacterium]
MWGHDRAVTDRTVDVYILRLRQEDRGPARITPLSAACAVSATASTPTPREIGRFAFAGIHHYDCGTGTPPQFSLGRLVCHSLAQVMRHDLLVRCKPVRLRVQQLGARPLPLPA